MTTAIVKGSLADLSQRDGRTLAETFLGAEVVAIVDVSGSMATHDAHGRMRRWDAACAELAKLQQRNPGKTAIVAFGSHPQFCAGGSLPPPAGGTDLAAALTFVMPADGTVRFVVVSDGQPDDEAAALRVASRMTSRVDTVHVGPEDDVAGRAFLERLAAAHGGTSAVAGYAHELAATVEQLALTAGQ
jgi:Mg-chelatase subunit ChlD